EFDPGLGRWERQSTPLQVSELYERKIRSFREYYQQEVQEIGDSSLEQEYQLMGTILQKDPPDQETNEDPFT
ncbi:MAG: hypothetical protein SVU32_00435, partial [Candidatus Nanohaloarchaea archaeon]|nr:hypothetical protein [Candidatus Nanohaloarchaea archaeon]